MVVGITWPDGYPTQPQNVLVKFHNSQVGCISRVSVEGDAEAVPIEPVMTQFMAERESVYKGLNYLYLPVGLLLFTKYKGYLFMVL